MGCFELAQRLLHRGELRVAADARVQRGRDVLRAAVDALHVLEQADHLRDRLRERVVQLLGDRRDLRAHLGADVPLDEVVDLIEPHQRAERLVGEVHRRVDQQLLRELDDRAVRAADVPARAALRAQAGDDLDDEVDLVRQQRVQVDEAVARQLGELDVGGEPRVLGQATAVLVEELAERGLRGGVLREHAAARDLGDVRRLEMDLEREAVHQPRELDLLVVETADELAELLLRSDDDPVLAAALHAEALHDRLQVEHLLNVAGDELADLVDDEHQSLAGPAPLHQLGGTFGELAGRDVGLVLDRLHPGVGDWVSLRIEAVHDPARLAQRERDLALLSASSPC